MAGGSKNETMEYVCIPVFIVRANSADLPHNFRGNRYVEFLQISLLRAGLVDQVSLDSIRNQFDILDINQDERVSRLEVAAMVRRAGRARHCVFARNASTQHRRAAGDLQQVRRR